MKILWLTISDMTGEPVHRSLQSLKEHEVTLLHYRQDWNVDQQIRNMIADFIPDCAVFSGTAGGPNLPKPETLAEININVPIIHFCADTSDPPWWPYLESYRAAKSFRMTVNIDGNDEWPKEGRDITLLTPIDPAFYDGALPLEQRPIQLGFCGGYPDGLRKELIEHLQAECGLVVKPRNEMYGSYQSYSDFMKQCRIVVNVPISGSGVSRQVKGRVLEAGWAGCCLVDLIESAAGKWFDPYNDYLSYFNVPDAAHKMKSLFNSPDEMRRRAYNLSVKVRRDHSPQVFWNKVFERAMG
jgi:glycosyl transferase family 1